MEAKLNKYLCFRFVNRRFLCSFFCLYTRYIVDIQKKKHNNLRFSGFFLQNLSLDALSFSILLLTLFFGITQMEKSNMIKCGYSNRTEKKILVNIEHQRHICLQKKTHLKESNTSIMNCF